MIRTATIITAIILLAARAEAQVPELLYLKGNEGSGTMLVDDALVGFVGFSPTLSTTGSNPWTGGRVGAHALRFASSPAGSGSSVWNLGLGLTATGDWTVEFWFRLNQMATGQTGSSTPCLLSAWPGGMVCGYGWNPTAGIGGLGLETSLTGCRVYPAIQLGTWVHLAFVNDHGERTTTAYIDGVPGLPYLPTGASTLDLSSSITLGDAALHGDLDELRIWNRARSSAEIGASMNSELAPFADDIAVAAIRKPVVMATSPQLPGATEAVRCRLMNVGTNSILSNTPLSVSFSVDGVVQATEAIALPQTLAPGAEYVHNFATTADLSGPGAHVVDVTISYLADQNPANDSKARRLGGDYGFLISEFPYFESFDYADPSHALYGDVFPYWTQEIESPDDDWIIRDVGNIGGVNLGITAHAFLRDTSAGSISMQSPLIDLRGITNPRLRFRLLNDANWYPAGAPSFAVDVIPVATGILTLNVYGPVGDLGPGFEDVQIDLAPWIGQAIKIRLRAIKPSPVVYGAWYTSPVIVDDLRIDSHPIDTGQAPQPGLALFDCTGALNIGDNRPVRGEPGPYLARASVGQTMLFEFEGLPLRPIVLLYGPLNRAAASFPGIGQLDIGGPVDPTTGIPTSIGILFDGNLAYGLHPFFKTDLTGRCQFGFSMPNLPPGPVTTFQAIFQGPLNWGPRLSNAIEVVVQ